MDHTLTLTERAEIRQAAIRTPQPSVKPVRSWAIDHQTSRDTITGTLRGEGTRGGVVQFEEADSERVGIDADPAIEAQLAEILGSGQPHGSEISTLYTSKDCQIGRVRVQAFSDAAPVINPADAFARTRHALIGVTGEPTANDSTVELAGSTDPIVVVVPGVARRLSAEIVGGGGAVLVHRQGGSALPTGPTGELAPEQGVEADEALQVYTGFGWRPYGLLIAVPGADGWPGSAPGVSTSSLHWQAEVLRSNGTDQPTGSVAALPLLAPVVQPAPSGGGSFGVRDAAPYAGLIRVEVDYGPPPPTEPTLPTSDFADAPLNGTMMDREGFVAGLRVRFLDANDDEAEITGGKATVTVITLFRPAVSQTFVVRSQIYVAGPGVSANPSETILDLTTGAGTVPRVAVVPAKGARLYWPSSGVDRRLRIRLNTESRDLVQVDEPFALSGVAPHRLVVEAIVSA